MVLQAVPRMTRNGLRHVLIHVLPLVTMSYADVDNFTRGGIVHLARFAKFGVPEILKCVRDSRGEPVKRPSVYRVIKDHKRPDGTWRALGVTATRGRPRKNPKDPRGRKKIVTPEVKK